jgi:hypothetical protein
VQVAGSRPVARPATLIAIRTMLVANAVMMIIIGFICVLFVDHPHPVLLAIGAWAVAAALLAGTHWTDPYVRDWHR